MRKKKVHSREFLNFSKALSDEIRRIRSERNLTLEEVEELSRGRIKWRHLQKIETYSSNNMQIDTFYNICKVFKVHPFDLLKNIRI